MQNEDESWSEESDAELVFEPQIAQEDDDELDVDSHIGEHGVTPLSQLWVSGLAPKNEKYLNYYIYLLNEMNNLMKN